MAMVSMTTKEAPIVKCRTITVESQSLSGRGSGQSPCCSGGNKRLHKMVPNTFWANNCRKDKQNII